LRVWLYKRSSSAETLKYIVRYAESLMRRILIWTFQQC